MDQKNSAYGRFLRNEVHLTRTKFVINSMFVMNSMFAMNSVRLLVFLISRGIEFYFLELDMLMTLNHNSQYF